MWKNFVSEIISHIKIEVKNMPIKVISNDELKQQAMAVAEKNNIDETDFVNRCQALFNEVKDEELSDSEKERRVYRRFIGSLRKKNASNCDSIIGYLFARERNKDFSSRRRKEVKDYLQEHTEEEAQKNGYIDSEGNYLYDESDPFNDGVIPEETAKGKYYGIFMNKDDELEVHSIFLAPFNVNTVVPLFQPIELCKKDGNEDKMFNSNMFLLNNFTPLEANDMPLNFEEMNGIYDELLATLPSEWFIDNYDALVDYAEQKDLPRNNCLIMQGSVLEKGNNNDPTKPTFIRLADNDMSDFNCWVSPEVRDTLPVFSEEADVIAILSVYVRSDGEIGCNLLGILPFISPVE
jgi:hypothetical protein